jgi:hypothetical protein
MKADPKSCVDFCCSIVTVATVLPFFVSVRLFDNDLKKLAADLLLVPFLLVQSLAE